MSPEQDDQTIRSIFEHVRSALPEGSGSVMAVFCGPRVHLDMMRLRGANSIALIKLLLVSTAETVAREQGLVGLEPQAAVLNQLLQGIVNDTPKLLEAVVRVSSIQDKSH